MAYRSTQSSSYGESDNESTDDSTRSLVSNDIEYDHTLIEDQVSPDLALLPQQIDRSLLFYPWPLTAWDDIPLDLQAPELDADWSLEGYQSHDQREESFAYSTLDSSASLDIGAWLIASRPVFLRSSIVEVRTISGSDAEAVADRADSILKEPQSPQSISAPPSVEQEGRIHSPDLLQVSEGLSTRIFEIPGVIESAHSTKALGDFCAKKNFMKTAHAQSLGLKIDRKDLSSVTIGSGKKIITSGTVETQFRFRDESEIYSLVFHLIPDCIHDVILGKPFLKATKTFSSLTNCARRVVKRVIHGFTSRTCLYLGDSAPRFRGHCDGRVVEALADTGCKVLIMDEDYARESGIPVVVTDENRIMLRFADNSTAMTTGMAYGVQWQFGHSRWCKCEAEHHLDFHILKNAPAAIILSDEFLFDNNAFAEFDSYLVDEDDDDEDAHFFAIDIDSNHYKRDPPKLNRDVALHAELIRRGKEDDSIADLSTAEQTVARLSETQRRVDWDAQFAQHVCVPSPAASASVPQQSNGASAAPPPRRKSRWRFRLKPKKRKP